ncbi:MAG: TIGR00645 family protein [Betaproteobacteria bacterium]|nr:TIGR00645 family protein [Betaproteobacteria bacterium]
MSEHKSPFRPLKPLPNLIFMSRWLQVPLYLGLIVAQVIYVWQFGVELKHLLEGIFNSSGPKMTEADVMLLVLGLIDVVMISNLLVMVIVGGYETFVSRMHLEGHPDQPEWLSHVNAAVLKVKLATAIIGISSIHLLKSFIDAGKLPDKVLLWQTIIHMAFIFSALSIAWIDRIMDGGKPHAKHARDDF